MWPTAHQREHRGLSAARAYAQDNDDDDDDSAYVAQTPKNKTYNLCVSLCRVGWIEIGMEYKHNRRTSDEREI